MICGKKFVEIPCLRSSCDIGMIYSEGNCILFTNNKNNIGWCNDDYNSGSRDTSDETSSLGVRSEDDLFLEHFSSKKKDRRFHSVVNAKTFY